MSSYVATPFIRLMKMIILLYCRSTRWILIRHRTRTDSVNRMMKTMLQNSCAFYRFIDVIKFTSLCIVAGFHKEIEDYIKQWKTNQRSRFSRFLQVVQGYLKMMSKQWSHQCCQINLTVMNSTKVKTSISWIHTFNIFYNPIFKVKELKIQQFYEIFWHHKDS